MDVINQQVLRLSNLRLHWPQIGFPLGTAAGLVALAELPTAAVRTALTGNAALLDALIICPGFHRQHLAAELNQAEYPAVAALTTGYVFRVENPATVFFLQRISRTGALTNLTVSHWKQRDSFGADIISKLWTFQNATPLSTMAYLALPSLTTLALSILVILHDTTGITVLSLFILARLLNTIIIAQRSSPNWHGQAEPGVHGDLLVLLSQDRWVRLRGLVDDLKATTSGQWLRPPTFLESAVQSTATLTAYAAAGLTAASLTAAMSSAGQLVLLALFVATAALLAIANEATTSLFMHGCTMQLDPKHGVKHYARRLELVEDMLREPERNDAMMRLGLARMGVTVPEANEDDGKSRGGIGGSVTM